MQEELRDVRTRLEAAGAAAGVCQQARAAVQQRRTLVARTMEPLQAELDKLEVLLAGLSEMDGRLT